VGIGRAVLSVPGHALFGVIMGYYFSLAKFIPLKTSSYLVKSMLIPALIHGLFDFFLNSMSWVTAISPYLIIVLFTGFFVFLFFLYRIGLKRIKIHLERSVFKTQKP
jgi:protease PrsW